MNPDHTAHQDVAEDVAEDVTEVETSEGPPADPLVERMARRREALMGAREALKQSSPLFGTAALNPGDLLVVADWLLAEPPAPLEAQAAPRLRPVTLDEVDSLPEGTVLLLNDGRVLQRTDHRDLPWRSPSGGSYYSPQVVNTLRARLLYTPGGEDGGLG